jgi:hypothetical protein
MYGCLFLTFAEDFKNTSKLFFGKVNDIENKEVIIKNSIVKFF